MRCCGSVKSTGSGVRLPGFESWHDFTSCVTRAKLLTLSVPQFPHLPNDSKRGTYITGLL